VKNVPRDCPCHSGKPYRACCKPFHDGAEPTDAVTMMRSRYAAFSLGDAPYLLRTMHPDHEDRKLPEREVLVALAESARSYRYMGLTIVDHDEAEGRARVLFQARLFEKGKDSSFVELSRFRHDGVGFRYEDGSLLPANRIPGGLEGLSIPAFEKLFKGSVR
jgi:SEC-C motif-containing protein